MKPPMIRKRLAVALIGLVVAVTAYIFDVPGGEELLRQSINLLMSFIGAQTITDVFLIQAGNKES